MDTNIKGRGGLLFSVFFLVLVIHVLSPVRTPGDSRWSIPTAVCLERQGNAALNEFNIPKKNDYYGLINYRGQYLSIFPVGTSVLVVPVVWVVDRVTGFLGWPPEKIIDKEFSSRLERALASLIVILTALIIFQIIRTMVPGKLPSLFLVFIFAFCSPAWSTASRALWQHGPSMLFLSAALYGLLLAETKPALVWLVGPVLAFSYVIRPTNGLSLVVMTLYVFIKFRKEFVKFCLGAGLVLLVFFIFNRATYGAFLPAYYLPDRIGSVGRFWEALAGNLFSPARGLFIFCPVFIFSFYGFYLKVKNEQAGLLDAALMLIVLSHYLVISSFPHWWGGHSYGPRFFCDLVPFLIFFMVPAVHQIFENTADFSGRKLLKIFFMAAVIFSFYTNFHGATAWSSARWNLFPKNIDSAPERLWDWTDLQFFR